MRKTLVLVILAAFLGVGGWLWFREQPAQQINRTVDQLFENVAHQKISVRNPADTRKALKEIFAEEVKLVGLPGLPDEVLPRKSLLSAVDTFQKLTTLCEFAEQERNLQIEGKAAQAYRTTTVIFAHGPKTRTSQSWDLTFDLRKQDRWRITAIRASRLSGN